MQQIQQIMKKVILFLSAIIVSSATSMAFDLKDALKKIGKNGNNEDLESTIGGVLNNVLTTDKIDIKTLEGTWSYSAPAVAFKSDNLLKKAGGGIASEAITGKLTPIYQKTGIDKLIMTIDAEGNFNMKLSKVTLKGTIEPITDENSQANFAFNIKAVSRNITKMNAYVQKSATGTLSITFDISKLISLVETAGKLTKKSSIQSVATMLKSYDGLCAGFELKK